VKCLVVSFLPRFLAFSELLAHTEKQEMEMEMEVETEWKLLLSHPSMKFHLYSMYKSHSRFCQASPSCVLCFDSTEADIAFLE